MVTDRNPYAPPAADVVLPAQKTAAPSKRSLLPLWRKDSSNPVLVVGPVTV